MKTSWQNNISLFKLAINDGIENCICMHQQHTHTKHVNNLLYYIGYHITYIHDYQAIAVHDSFEISQEFLVSFVE